jgi:hypothetical protein
MQCTAMQCNELLTQAQKFIKAKEGLFFQAYTVRTSIQAHNLIFMVTFYYSTYARYSIKQTTEATLEHLPTQEARHTN